MIETIDEQINVQFEQQQANHVGLFERFKRVAGRVALAAGISVTGMAAEGTPNANAAAGQPVGYEAGIAEPYNSIEQAALLSNESINCPKTDSNIEKAFGTIVCIFGQEKGITFKYQVQRSKYNETSIISNFTDITTGKQINNLPDYGWVQWQNSTSVIYNVNLTGGEYDGDIVLPGPIGQSKSVEIPWGPIRAGTQGVAPPPDSCLEGVNSPPGGTPVDIEVIKVENCNGAWVATNTGNVIDEGNATNYDKAHNVKLKSPIVDIVPTPDKAGYWLASQNGSVYSIGDAKFYGSVSGKNQKVPFVGMAATADGKGYWLERQDGSVYSYGDAKYHGSISGKHVSKVPFVGMAATADGEGYWLARQDGSVYSYGDAKYLGGGRHLDGTVVGIVAVPQQGGYRLATSAGEVIAFHAGTYGDLVSEKKTSPSPIVSISDSTDGKGYELLAGNGDLYSYGDAPQLANVPTNF